MDLLNEVRVDAGPLDCRLEDRYTRHQRSGGNLSRTPRTDEEVLGAGILERTFSSAGDGGANGGDDNDVVVVLLEDGGAALRGGVELGGEGGNAGLSTVRLSV